MPIDVDRLLRVYMFLNGFLDENKKNDGASLELSDGTTLTRGTGLDPGSGGDLDISRVPPIAGQDPDIIAGIHNPYPPGYIPPPKTGDGDRYPPFVGMQPVEEIQARYDAATGLEEEHPPINMIRTDLPVTQISTTDDIPENRLKTPSRPRSASMARKTQRKISKSGKNKRATRRKNRK